MGKSALSASTGSRRCWTSRRLRVWEQGPCWVEQEQGCLGGACSWMTGGLCFVVASVQGGASGRETLRVSQGLAQVGGVRRRLWVSRGEDLQVGRQVH